MKRQLLYKINLFQTQFINMKLLHKSTLFPHKTSHF